MRTIAVDDGELQIDPQRGSFDWLPHYEILPGQQFKPVDSNQGGRRRRPSRAKGWPADSRRAINLKKIATDNVDCDQRCRLTAAELERIVTGLITHRPIEDLDGHRLKGALALAGRRARFNIGAAANETRGTRQPPYRRRAVEPA